MVVVVVAVVAVVAVVVVVVVVGVIVAAVVSGGDVVLLCALGGTVDTRKELDSDSSSDSMVAADVEGAVVAALAVSIGAVVAGALCVVTVEKDMVAEGSVVGFGLGLIGSAVVVLRMFSVGCCDPRLEVSITAACESSAFSLG